MDKFVVCVCGVDSARLLQNQTAYARVLLLGGLQYIAERVEFLEQALATDLLGRADKVGDPRGDPIRIDVGFRKYAKMLIAKG